MRKRDTSKPADFGKRVRADRAQTAARTAAAAEPAPRSLGQRIVRAVQSLAGAGKVSPKDGAQRTKTRRG